MYVSGRGNEKTLVDEQEKSNVLFVCLLRVMVVVKVKRGESGMKYGKEGKDDGRRSEIVDENGEGVEGEKGNGDGGKEMVEITNRRIS